MPNLFLVVAFVLCGLGSNVFFWKMVSEVNARLANDQKFSVWWWPLGKYVRLWKEHKRLLPSSRWRQYWALSFAAVVVLMILIILSAN